MSSPFDNAYTQRVDKVSTALNEGNAAEAAYQMRGMVEDDPRQAIRLIQDAERISSGHAIDSITGDCMGDIFIFDSKTRQYTFAGNLGSHGTVQEPLEPPTPHASVGDQCFVPPQVCNDYPDYSVPQWQQPRWLTPFTGEYELQPPYAFNCSRLYSEFNRGTVNYYRKSNSFNLRGSW